MSDQRNTIIRAFATDTRNQLVQKMNELGIEHRSNSDSPQSAQRALKKGTKSRQGLIDRVSFRFPRHMVFVHKGVGKGTPISKAGQTNRKAKEWFNPVVEDTINQLADDLAAEYAELATERIFIK